MILSDLRRFKQIVRKSDKISHCFLCGLVTKYVDLTKNNLYCLATTASWGSSGSGAASRACKLNKTVRRVMAAAHWSFRISRHIAPVTLEMLGCQIFVTNRTFINCEHFYSVHISFFKWNYIRTIGKFEAF